VPRKTKKEKILARLHRLEQQAETPASDSSVGLQNRYREVVSSQDLIKQEPKIEKPLAAATSGQDYSYIYKDLRKIFILTAVAISAEIVLSLTASTSYAKLVLRTFKIDF